MAIPEGASEIIDETYESGAKMRASYFVDGQQVGWRFWSENGILTMEFEMRDGKYHGRHRTWFDTGRLCEEGYYEDGKEHGETKQYDWDGKQIGSYVMDHGTGLDLWYQAQGILAEERGYRGGERHGFERWWTGDNRTVFIEEHYLHGREHGIFRKWNRKGKLARGFPKYYVAGKPVTKRQYLRVCQSDPTLPPFSPDDNAPHRLLPTSFVSVRP